MRGVSIIITSLTGLMLASCSGVPAPQQRTAKQQELFARMTADKVAGAPMSCLSTFRMDDMRVIDGRTIAFGPTVGSTKVVNLSDGCEALSSNNYAIQTNNIGLGLCTGDIVRVVDPMNHGMFVGSCVVKSIIPYSRPR